MRFFCPKCWSDFPDDIERHPKCGLDIDRLPACGVTLTLSDGVPRLFTHLALDFTGTLSLDGSLLPGVEERLRELAKAMRIVVLTADTFGKAESRLKGLPVGVKIIRTGEDKADYLREAGPERTVAIGNGVNDLPMMKMAGLRIAVIGPEGASAELIRAADVVVNDSLHALDLIRYPLRLKATLRK